MDPAATTTLIAAPRQNQQRMSKSAIAGAVLGSVAALTLLLAAGVMWLRKRNRSRLGASAGQRISAAALPGPELPPDARYMAWEMAADDNGQGPVKHELDDNGQGLVKHELDGNDQGPVKHELDASPPERCS